MMIMNITEHIQCLGFTQNQLGDVPKLESVLMKLTSIGACRRAKPQEVEVFHPSTSAWLFAKARIQAASGRFEREFCTWAATLSLKLQTDGVS
jgi:hypothetical protein